MINRWIIALALLLCTGCINPFGKKTPNVKSPAKDIAPPTSDAVKPTSSVTVPRKVKRGQNRKKWRLTLLRPDGKAPAVWKNRDNIPTDLASFAGVTRSFSPPSSSTFNNREHREKMEQAYARNQALYAQLIKKLSEPAHPSDVPAMTILLESKYSPLSSVAAAVLAHIRTAEAEAALENALKFPRSDVRRAALAGLVDMRAVNASAHCKSLFANDPNAHVKVTAIMGAVALRDKSVIPEMIKYYDRAPPSIRLVIAWGLAAFNDPRGVPRLESYAISGQPRSAVPAMYCLAKLGQVSSIPIFINMISSNKMPIAVCALSILESVPPQLLHKAINRKPPAQAEGFRRLYALLRYAYLGKGKIPATAYELIEQGDFQQKLIATKCLIRGQSIRNMSGLISVVATKNRHLQGIAYPKLVSLAKKYNLAPVLERSASLQKWQHWWFRQHHILASKNTHALLLFAGKEKTVKVGSRLAWDTVVKKVVAGSGKSGTLGASVEIMCGTRPYILYSLPENMRK